MPETHRVVAERIVGTGRHCLRQRPAVGFVLAAHGFRRIPDGLLALVDDARHAERRLPVHLADADRIGHHDPRLASLGAREVIQAMLGEADDEPFARLLGQDVARGNQHARALARQPRIDARIGSDDLLVADAIAASEIEQRVHVLRDNVLNFAEDRVFAAGQRIGGCVQLRAHCTARQPGGQPQGTRSIAGLHRGVFNTG
jgi:hypothetical protein